MKPTSLGELEQKVMKIVWRRQECSIKEIQKELGRNRKLAYTTVATIVQRLYDKELLKRMPENRAYLYSPKVSKQSYGNNLAQSFFKKFFNSFPDVALASFAETIEGLPKEKRKYLLKLLEGPKNAKT